ncbi:UPF0481 protein At3g47200 [Jatropha curcas]|uniref:UPF0481 protein At3g47200 n=1 Tax=Jatropha curcas TaxID=180498 RepID=UPI0018941C18|nr:UPF0481 protein At3g47200 [Jatropha curcas]
MGQNGEGSNSNDVEAERRKQLVIDIPDNLEPLLSQPALWPEICIYRVPRKLRAINPSAYTPQMISIGPFHRIYLAEFCRRTGKTWVELENKIREYELKIRHCYDQTFEQYEQNMFVRMILLDSVFIIEFFLKRETTEESEEYKADYILGKPSSEDAILEDLILLENQLPYFVLENLYEFATGNSADFRRLVMFNLSEKLPGYFLVDTERECGIAIQNGNNLLGEHKSVAEMVNKLCLEIKTRGSCFYGVSVDLNKHYENCWFKTGASMRSVYFSNLWRGAGTVVALSKCLLGL